MGKRALILGIGGQDGSYLADLLLAMGYEVHGIVRRSSVDNLGRIRHLEDRIQVHTADLADPLSIHRVIAEVRPLEVYNEADQDYPTSSFDTVAYSADITTGAVARTLESIRLIDNGIRFFQPLSATIFGKGEGGTTHPPYHSYLLCSESTTFNPQSPYAVAKCGTYYWCKFYRDYYGMPVSTGILFSHDSPRRSPIYFLQRICRWAARPSSWYATSPFEIGNKDWVVDIGAAADVVRAIHLINTAESAEDWVVGTGVPHTAEYWVNLVAELEGAPADVELFNYTNGVNEGTVADISKIRYRLDWCPLVSDTELLTSILESLTPDS